MTYWAYIRWAVTLTVLTSLGWLARGRFRRWSLTQLRRVRRGRHRLRTQHGTVEYQLVGQGPVVMLIHGAPGGSDGWRMYSFLREAGYTLLSPSRPGYLGTPLRSGRTLKAQAALFIALLDHLNIDTVVIVGFSMGGPLALEIASRYPNRVRGVVLQSAITHAYALKDPLEETLFGSSWVPRLSQSLLLWLSHRLFHYVPQLAARSLLWASYQGPDIASCVEQVMTSPAQRRMLQAIFDSGVPLRHRQRGYDNDVRQLRRLHIPPLPKINMPTLILHSRSDASVPFRHAEHAHKNLPNVQLVEATGCGHFVFLGANGETAQAALLSFLGRLG